jgi:hypothetical protein
MRSVVLEFRKWFESVDDYDPDNPDWWKDPADRESDDPTEPSEETPTDHQPTHIWTLRFSDAKRDAIEGYYYDLSKLHAPLLDLKTAKKGTIHDIEVGDQIADLALNRTPYWVVQSVDIDTHKIYVSPIEPNPFATGVGAGGKVLDDHDFEVHSGEYEKKRVDGILKRIQDKSIHDPSDVAYLLLGTVPLNMGPNGAQGGWYSSSDTFSNRGGAKGMDAHQIQSADAHTLVKLGFDVPPRALKGGLSPQVWNSFVQGNDNYTTPYGDEDPNLYDDRLNGENYTDPKAMAHHILNHPQRNIRARNANALIDHYRGKDRLLNGGKSLWELEQDVIDAYNAGHYTRRELEPLLKQVAQKLATERPPEYDHIGFDRFYNTREQFIALAKEQGWNDILRLFEKALDPLNRRRVFDHYSERDKPDAESMTRMLDYEHEAENISTFLSRLRKVDFDAAYRWRLKNADRIQRAIDNDQIGYYSKDLKFVVNIIDDFARALNKGKNI